MHRKKYGAENPAHEKYLVRHKINVDR